MMTRRLAACMLMAILAGCTAAPTEVATGQPLEVKVLYPLKDTSIRMGQSLKAIVQVSDANGAAVTDAEVTLTLRDASGATESSLRAIAGAGDVYRSEPMPIAHRTAAGMWELTAEANRAGQQGAASAAFQVTNSISEDLLQKYGFWVDEPSLGDFQTALEREVGDAQNGDVFWGGFKIAMHILPESHIEIYWRKGNFHLESSEQVRSFLLDDVGNLGFIPLRDLGEFQRVRFKQWDAWQGTARGRLQQYDIQFMVFYAPEVDKTYALSTKVVLPPAGIDAHTVLREGFEVHPEVDATGKAPDPLLRLLPTPVLLAPALGTRFMGAANPIILTWQPVKQLAQDEYYLVKIDYDYKELNSSRYYTTRETQFTLPKELFATPNCGVFNWQVTLMHETGRGKDGEPTGEPLSYDSLHWYVEWLYPSADQAPFLPACQNPQT